MDDASILPCCLMPDEIGRALGNVFPPVTERWPIMEVILYERRMGPFNLFCDDCQLSKNSIQS